MSSGLEDISISISLLDNLEKHDKGAKNGPIRKVKKHVKRLRNGLVFLGKLYVLMNENLARRVKDYATDLKQKLTNYKFSSYKDLRRMVKLLVTDVRLVINPENDDESFRIFQKDMHYNYRRIIDLLLERIAEVLMSTNNKPSLVTEVEKMRMALTYYKPLYTCLAHRSCLYNDLIHVPLDHVLNKAAVAIFLLLVHKTDKKIVVLSLKRIIDDVKKCRKLDLYIRFLKFSCVELSSEVKGQFFILDNLINVLEMNSDSLNDANNHLYGQLRALRTFVTNERENERFNCYLGLTASTEAICYQAVPIVYSCYVEEVELEKEMPGTLKDILTDVIGQIKTIKSGHGSQQEINLCDYSRVDGLGFLEFFLGHLNELLGHDNISDIRNEVMALHTDISYLVEGKLTSEGLSEDVVRWAYQAEYVIDLYLVIPDSRCISTLSNIVKKVKEIKAKMHALPDKSLAIKDIVGASSSHVHDMPPGSNNEFVGFEEEVNSITQDLLGGEKDLQTISVVGMAGAGKTYLAMHLFNQSSVVQHFDKKAWCTVSQSYETKDLLLTTINQIQSVEYDIRKIEEQDLADNLCRSLKKLRYLVVIDDIWDVSLWSELRPCFPDDGTDSRIIITTRDRNIASEAKSVIHELRPLTEVESWELMQKKLSQPEHMPTNILTIAKRISESCKGLPLSIVIIGGVMHKAERNEEMWNRIGKDVTSTILSDPQGKCKDILELSYNYLPSHLKACLLYLGVFPEDHEISVKRLVRLWVSEGLVRGREDVGKRYVVDLVTRSLVIPIKVKKEGGIKILRLHDILRDFCLEKVKDEHFFAVLDDGGISNSWFCPRRISINRGMDKHLPVITLNSVRTIISFCKSSLMDGDIERVMKSERMILVNVLDIRELIDASYVLRFVNLRYLAIWKITRSDQVLLESSFSKLRNLQILILSFDVKHVFEVPDFIWGMVKLRHIQLLPSALFPRHDSKSLEDSPVLLENLKFLAKPRLHYGDSNWLTKLPELQKLSCIFVYSSNDKKHPFPELGFCTRLTSLKVENGEKKSKRTRSNNLQFPAGLRKLSLSKFILESDDISEIGLSLPNLEVLKLRKCVEKWSVNDESFQNLKVLTMTGGYFQEWDASEDSFPSLEQLWLKSCYSLKEIPLRFGDIPNLRLIAMKDCNQSVHNSAKEIEKIQVEAANSELKVNIS